MTPNDLGEIDCQCNRCGDIKLSLPYLICDHFEGCSGCYEPMEYVECLVCNSMIPAQYFDQHNCDD